MLAALGCRMLAALGCRMLAALGCRMLAALGCRMLAALGCRMLAALTGIRHPASGIRFIRHPFFNPFVLLWISNTVHYIVRYWRLRARRQTNIRACMSRVRKSFRGT